jgi:hypothetical protein
MLDAFQINDSSLYVIDTSALILLDFNFPKSSPVFTAIWEEMEEMIHKGILHTIDYVETEINDYEGKETFLQNWVKLNRRKFVRLREKLAFNIRDWKFNIRHLVFGLC